MLASSSSSSYSILPYPATSNPTGISLFSFHIRDTVYESVSPWVNSVFGSESVWYNESINHFFVADPLSLTELRSRNITATGLFRTKLPTTTSTCSIEMLGYVELGMDEPYMFGSIRKGPSFISANITIDPKPGKGKSSSPFTWPCIGRGLYENWRQERRWMKSHWTTLFICPSPQPQKSCSELMVTGTGLTAKLNIKMRKKAFALGFDVQRSGIKDLPSPVLPAETTPTDVYVCSALPYSSSDPNKILINKGMLLEWVHYHSQLGMAVVLYDRSGTHYQYIMGNSRHERKLGKIKKLLLYHNFTVRELIENSGPRHGAIGSRPASSM
jgi:hypothetical protein